MKTINVTKMQGLGNDFVILDYPEYEKTGLSMPELAKKLCDRHFGVGADGMIIPKLDTQTKIIEREDKEPLSFTPDIGWYFYNSDGSIAQMCGNGIRCFAKYAKDKKLINTDKFVVETLAGHIIPEILENGEVKVNMSKPILTPKEIPFGGDKNLNFEITIDDKTFKANAISMGNPHCVIFVEDDCDLLDLAKTYGPKIEVHPLFCEKTNVEFVKVKSRTEIDMRVWERGCGITMACGTGACACVVAGVLNNLTENEVRVNLLGGALTIEWQGLGQNSLKDVFMSGPAQYSFFAQYIL